MAQRAFRTMTPRRSPSAARVIRTARRISMSDGLIWLALAVGLGALGVLYIYGAAPAAAEEESRSVATVPLSTAEYVRKSAISDIFEMNAGNLAAEKSADPAIREFGRAMVDEHARSSNDLKMTLQQANVKASVPTTLDREHQELLKELQFQSGDQFDRTFLQAQLKGHRDALDLQRAYSQSGDNEALRKIAAEKTPVVEEHLAKLEVLAQNSFHSPNGGNLASSPGGKNP